MDFELSALAAGLPMGASFAMAGGFVALREARRRTSLNAALHELRRPLQALSLWPETGSAAGLPPGGSLELAVAALEALDQEINGRRDLAAAKTFFLRPLVEAAVARWRPVAAEEKRDVRLSWSGCDKALQGSPIALAQAVDNLLSNALAHGSGPIALEVACDGREILLSVRDDGPGPPASGARRSLSRRRDRRRHGHGLRIVRRVAARHGGRFRLVYGAAGTEARLALPLSGRDG